MYKRFVQALFPGGQQQEQQQQQPQLEAHTKGVSEHMSTEVEQVATLAPPHAPTAAVSCSRQAQAATAAMLMTQAQRKRREHAEDGGAPPTKRARTAVSASSSAPDTMTSVDSKGSTGPDSSQVQAASTSGRTLAGVLSPVLSLFQGQQRAITSTAAAEDERPHGRGAALEPAGPTGELQPVATASEQNDLAASPAQESLVVAGKVHNESECTNAVDGYRLNLSLHQPHGAVRHDPTHQHVHCYSHDPHDQVPEAVEHELTASDEEEDEYLDFDPLIFIRSLPRLEDVPGLSKHRQPILPRKTRQCKQKTLVLDLDETLVHSSLEPVAGADFSFPVHFNSQEHMIHVRKRPHLHTFMERVAELYEVVVFTASQKVYAEKLLNVIDPKRQLIKHRIYRDSCVIVDGNYMKDLSVLGRDLAGTMIIDNSPQAFGFQVENGIPIESWYDDETDEELMKLLPFLESLADVDDVRPLISAKFRLRELIERAGDV